MDGWVLVDGWMDDGWMGGRAGLRNAYSNQIQISKFDYFKKWKKSLKKLQWLMY